MTKIKRFLECYIPTETCNLRCHYCYIAQKRKFNNKLAHFSHSLEEMRKAFSVERMGGVCLINLCAGGETLLSDEILPLVKELISEGHYIMIVTNGTLTNRFEEVAKWDPQILSHLFIKFSFHYLEFKRLGIFDKFFANVELMKNAGASFTVEITPSDELIPYIDDVKNICRERVNALCHVTIARDDRTDGIDVLSQYDFDSYKKIWETFDSDLFNFKKEIFYQKRNEFCYAGDWSVNINLETGDIHQCYCGKSLGNLYDFSKPISFEAIGSNCTLAHCYNGHAFLTLGVIPEMNTPTYDLLRNRICLDQSEWLRPEMKACMQTKLSESNKEYSSFKKWRLYSDHKIYRRIRRKLSQIKRVILK